MLPDRNSPALLGVLPSPEASATEAQLQSSGLISEGLVSPRTPTVSTRLEILDFNELESPPQHQHWKSIRLLKARIVGRLKQWRYRVSSKRKSSQRDGEDTFVKDMLLFKGGNSQTITFRRVRMDTGAPANLITQRSLIDVEHEIGETGFRIRGLLGVLIPRGKTKLRWIFRGEGQVYEDDFLILPDYAQADFDVLLGRPWMERNGYELQKRGLGPEVLDITPQ